MFEAVAEGLRVHGLHEGEEAKVADALSRAGLRPPERFYRRYPHELSGGQRQRVVIAGALVLDPEIIVADEPVSSLDASVRGEILALLLRLRDDLGLTLVVVTHDLGLAWNIADRVAVMYLGRILEIGPTEEIMSAPQHPYTKALLSVVPETAHLEPIVLAGETPDPARIPAGCRFHPRCPALADGTAAAAGVDGQCRTVGLPVLAAGVARNSYQRLLSRHGPCREVTLCRRRVSGRCEDFSRPSISITTQTRRPSCARRKCCGANGRASVAWTTSGLPRSGRAIPDRRAVVTFRVSRSSSPQTLPARCTRSRTCADTEVPRSCLWSRMSHPSPVPRNRCGVRITPGPTGWTAGCCMPPIPRTSIWIPRPSDYGHCAPRRGADSSGSLKIWRQLLLSTR